MTTPHLDFSQKEADDIYDELRELHVELDADPLSFGPKRLNGKIADTRKMLDRCERIFLDVSQRLHAVGRRLLVANTELDLSKKDLFASDPETRAGRSVSDREAIASQKLKKEVQEVNQLEQIKMSLESVLYVIKAKRTDLKDTQGRLRDQLKLCQEEIGLGNRWGSRSPNAPDLKFSNSTAGTVQDVDDILEGVKGQIHLAQQSGEWKDPEPMETPEDEVSDVSDEDGSDTSGDDSESEVSLEDDNEDSSEISNIKEYLPDASSNAEVESFLEDDIVPPDDGEPFDESAIDEILGSFESDD